MAKHFQVLVLRTALGTKVVRILLLHLSPAALVHWSRSTCPCCALSSEL